MKYFNKLTLISLIILNSCIFLPDPEHYMLDIKSPFPIEGFVLSGYASSGKVCDNQLYIDQNSTTAIKREGLTQFIFDATFTINKGDGIKFYLRNTYKSYNDISGIVFEYNQNGSKIFENGVLIAKVDSIKLQADSPTRIKIKQDGNYYDILVDCDTVIKATTKLVGTEYILMQSIQSNIDISGITLDEIHDFEYQLKLNPGYDNTAIREKKDIIVK